ncbi:pyroglutamyl-peptidase I [Arthrobacter sp. KK5.5]|uniref:pyroglutamyl-peptidase I n=1 Tax=Arthrobacter sp. KK5.5 TaxID=3373084 RepID=UPI003EE6FFD7
MILLTGFEPFDGAASNPSIDAATTAARALVSEGIPAVAEQLPCVFAEAPGALARAIERHRPDVVVCVGLAAGRRVVSLERVAINVLDARIPDNAGEVPVDRPVVEGAPAAYFTTLPIKRTLAALSAAGIDAEVSQTAGTYVCNQVFYALMHQAAGHGRRIRGGFVHVPTIAPDGGTGPTGADLACALRLVAVEALNPAPDALLVAGAES